MLANYNCTLKIPIIYGDISCGADIEHSVDAAKLAKHDVSKIRALTARKCNYSDKMSSLNGL